MKCSSCDSGKEGKCAGYQRRWDFYEWVDAFKGPRVNSLSKMIYWTKIHLFCVTPQKLFFPFNSLKTWGLWGLNRRMHKRFITPTAPLGQGGVVGGKCGGWVWQEECESQHSHTWCGGAGSGKVVAQHWQPHPLSSGPDAWRSTLWLTPAKSDRTRCKCLFPWTTLCGVQGAACETGSDLQPWMSAQLQSCFCFV